jgi:hypothetical protein
MTGPIWVNGNITFSNNSNLTIDASLGNAGLSLIADYQADQATKGTI